MPYRSEIDQYTFGNQGKRTDRVDFSIDVKKAKRLSIAMIILLVVVAWMNADYTIFDRWFFYGLCFWLLLIAFPIYRMWKFCRSPLAFLSVDSHGITRRSLKHQVVYTWEEMQKVEFNPKGRLNRCLVYLSTGDQPIEFDLKIISGTADDLLAAIRRFRPSLPIGGIAKS